MTKQTMKRHLGKAIAEKGRETLPSVLLAAAECTPLSKTGGLADVAGALPNQLISLGFDCRVITPFHRIAKEKYASRVEHICDFEIALDWRREYVGIEKLTLGKTTFYLVDNEHYFGTDIYWGGNPEGEQYAFFQRAVLEAIPRIGFIPDVLHCNDWHTALMPMLIKTQYQDSDIGGIKTQLTIHNLAYQGKFGFEFVKGLFGVSESLYTPQFLESFGCANFLKCGCVFADGLNTVSPTYAREICTPKFGESLDGILFERQEGLAGILNGIDKKLYDPYNDPNIAARFSRKNKANKIICKEEVQSELGLGRNTDAPLIGIVTRVTEQKGIDLFLQALPGILDLGAKVILLGAGNKQYEFDLKAAELKFKGKFCAYIGYNEGLANRIYAGSDFFLMPSRFEPCGISQMIAMRYGSLPIVRETGGLCDTVIPYNKFTGEGTGFSFSGYDAHELYEAVARAVEVYADKEVMGELMDNAMAMDFGFEASAFAYGMQYIRIV